jgi:hypothetical protein
MPNPILPDPSAPAAPQAAASPPSPPPAAGGRALATVLPAWDLVPPNNVIAFRRGPR